MSVTYIYHSFSHHTMGDLENTDVNATCDNLCEAIKAALLKDFPGAEIKVVRDMDSTEGETVVEGEDPHYKHNTQHAIRDIIQRVWDNQEFSWVDAAEA